jgi:predicted DsbA family dithiol-disulfide isomerase
MNVTPYEAGSFCEGTLGECHTSSQSSRHPVRHKPIEIYSFIDPICPECWALEPVLKKLHVEYGRYFKIRHLIGGKLDALNTYKKKKNGGTAINELAERWEHLAKSYGMPCDGDIWYENPIFSSYRAALAVKAAELQGKQVGIRFLRRLRELLFLEKQDVSNETILLNCARDTSLDLTEFERDMKEQGAVKAFQCDMKTTAEMEVDHLPTLVFLNANADEGIKISGCYPYEAYEHVIYEMLGRQAKTNQPPTIEEFLKKYRFVATKEIAVVYDLSCDEVERKMKRLLLQQHVERVPVKHGTFWRCLD